MEPCPASSKLPPSPFSPYSSPAAASAIGRAGPSAAKGRTMAPENLRIALVSGNYNYVRDGANQALNRLVGFLLREGVHVRVYSPTVVEPAFPPTGGLGSGPSTAAPRRG